MGRNNAIVSLCSFYAELVRCGATVHLADDDYTRTTPLAGRDPNLAVNPHGGRTLQVRGLVGSGEHVNVSFCAAQEAALVKGRSRRPVAVPRAINFIRNGRSCIGKTVVTIPDAEAFKRFQAADCFPSGAVHDPSLALTAKVHHLPLVDPRWADPKRLVDFLRRQDNLVAERDALKARGITPAPAKKPSAANEDGARPRHKEQRSEESLPTPVEAPPPHVAYGLVSYRPRFKSVDRLSVANARTRLRTVERALADVRLKLSLTVLALETGPSRLTWTDPKPHGRKGLLFVQEAMVDGVKISCVRSEPIAPVAAAA